MYWGAAGGARDPTEGQGPQNVSGVPWRGQGTHNVLGDSRRGQGSYRGTGTPECAGVPRDARDAIISHRVTWRGQGPHRVTGTPQCVRGPLEGSGIP